MLQASFEGVTFLRALGHFQLKELIIVATGILGLIHRKIRMLH